MRSVRTYRVEAAVSGKSIFRADLRNGKGFKNYIEKKPRSYDCVKNFQKNLPRFLY